MLNWNWLVHQKNIRNDIYWWQLCDFSLWKFCAETCSRCARLLCYYSSSNSRSGTAHQYLLHCVTDCEREWTRRNGEKGNKIYYIKIIFCCFFFSFILVPSSVSILIAWPFCVRQRKRIVRASSLDLDSAAIICYQSDPIHNFMIE